MRCKNDIIFLPKEILFLLLQRIKARWIELPVINEYTLWTRCFLLSKSKNSRSGGGKIETIVFSRPFPFARTDPV